MKCEICHQGEAEVATYVSDEHGTRELYVCRACANALTQHEARMQKQSLPLENTEHRIIFTLHPLGTPEQTSASESLLSDPFDFLCDKEPNEKEKNLVCPSCGSRWIDVRQQGAVGCARCYKAFASVMAATIRSYHQAKFHVGRIPEHPPREEARRYYNRLLQQAVQKQDFKTASFFRDKIKELDTPDTKNGAQS